MITRIGSTTLTTEHPQSSNNIPVLLMDGVAYGPEDIAPGTDHVLMGSAMSLCDDIYGIGSSIPDDDAIHMLCRWLSQSAEHGNRWIKTVRGAVAASRAGEDEVF